MASAPLEHRGRRHRQQRLEELQTQYTTTYGYDQAGNLTSVERPRTSQAAPIEEALAYDHRPFGVVDTSQEVMMPPAASKDRPVQEGELLRPNEWSQPLHAWWRSWQLELVYSFYLRAPFKAAISLDPFAPFMALPGSHLIDALEWSEGRRG